MKHQIITWIWYYLITVRSSPSSFRIRMDVYVINVLTSVSLLPQFSNNSIYFFHFYSVKTHECPEGKKNNLWSYIQPCSNKVKALVPKDRGGLYTLLFLFSYKTNVIVCNISILVFECPLIHQYFPPTSSHIYSPLLIAHLMSLPLWLIFFFKNLCKFFGCTYKEIELHNIKAIRKHLMHIMKYNHKL